MSVLGTLAQKVGAGVNLERVSRKVGEISTLPQVALRVMEVANDPKSGADTLGDYLENEPALSARLLRCVNSSAYGLRMKVSSLQQAVSLVGMASIRDLAMTACVSDLFKKDVAIGRYRRSHLWRHMVSVGIGARLIAVRLHCPDPDEAFLAGLLHDIGILLEDQYAHEPFAEVVGELHEGQTLCEVERAKLGFDHTVLGEKVAGNWRFPEPVKASIRHHHAAVNYRGEALPVVRCVELANLICSFKTITSVGVNLLRFSQPLLESLALKKADILALGSEINAELAKSDALFGI